MFAPLEAPMLELNLKATMDDSYTKNPQPYTSPVMEDYQRYKAAERRYTAARTTLARAEPTSIGNDEPDALPRLRAGEQLATDTLLASNSVAAARSGFDHKYSTAYEDREDKANHRKVAQNFLRRSSGTRKHRETIRQKIKDIQRKRPDDAGF
ncbi:uncharacterized protein BO80DRAFT_431333 [Aspergillus ibericus CBS 121593]|uniref:Uncharacterized protein n=1 Tax=Aspergillus ibericus CBS 121593 TaxID=1448316 RepID=A0A395HBS4_9EURO|nr:hypothetical protein BO80DRAFT_431333 [Aspergillus ibericus CBS 121593]RAL05391.1 hypothetical protein BO80DRAFT_431333 [Aspergillus ibericus CBS 121593]